MTKKWWYLIFMTSKFLQVAKFSFVPSAAIVIVCIAELCLFHWMHKKGLVVVVSQRYVNKHMQ